MGLPKINHDNKNDFFLTLTGLATLMIVCGVNEQCPKKIPEEKY